MNRSHYPKSGLKIQCLLLKNTEFTLFTPDPDLNIFSIKGLLYEEGKMNTIFLGVIALAIVITVIIFIYVMVALRKTIRDLGELMDTVENSIKPVVTELQETLRSIKNFTDSTAGITDDVSIFTGALRDTGKSVNHVTKDVERVVNLVEGITSLGVMEASSLKAGIKAGLWVLSKSLFKKR
jgi:uncharacterized protein YoxC